MLKTNKLFIALFVGFAVSSVQANESPLEKGISDYLNTVDKEKHITLCQTLTNGVFYLAWITKSTKEIAKAKDILKNVESNFTKLKKEVDLMILPLSIECKRSSFQELSSISLVFESYYKTFEKEKVELLNLKVQFKQLSHDEDGSVAQLYKNIETIQEQLDTVKSLIEDSLREKRAKL